MKYNRGFAVITIIAGVIIAAVVGGGAYYVATHSDQNQNEIIDFEPINEEVFNLDEPDVVVTPELSQDENMVPSCLVITNLAALDTIALPYTIAGYVDLDGAQEGACTRWGVFEGTAGTAVLKDQNGNIVSDLTYINSIGDYYTGMEEWPVSIAISGLTTTPYSNQVWLHMSWTGEQDGAETITQTIGPIIVVDSLGFDTELSSPYIGWHNSNGVPPTVQTSSTPYSCDPGSTGGDLPTEVREETINGTTYCIESFVDAGAGQRTGEYLYTRASGTGIEFVQFGLAWVNCGGYGGPGDTQYDQCISDTTEVLDNLDEMIDYIMNQ